MCYSKATSSIGELVAESDDSQGLIDKLVKSGHMSPFEHASFTFGVEDISRVTSHQLVRHRLASYSQRSQRHSDGSAEEIVCPPSVVADGRAKMIFEKIADKLLPIIIDLKELGIPNEDVRYILPQGITTSLVVTMNARELHHFFEVRLCQRAQWEIRELAGEMLRLVKEVAPMLFATAGPPCVTGECRESRPCERSIHDVSEVDGAQPA